MAEVYEMMMKLGLEGSAMAGLANISSVLTGMHHKVGQIEKGFINWKTALIGVGSLIGGALIIGGIEKLIEKTKTFSDELVKLKKSGGEMEAFVTSGEGVSKAFDISKRVGMSVTDLLKIPGMSYSILGKEEAVATWESLAKYSYTQKLGDEGFTGKKQEHALLDAIRAGEASGRLTDPVTGKMDIAKLDHWLDLVSKIKTATHGVVNEQSLLGLAKQGGPALRTMTDEGILGEAVMSQVLGGQRVGTATLSLMQQFAGGTMRKRTAVGMEELGLLNKEDWSTDKGGGVVLTDDASKRLNRLISKDPMELAAKLREEFMAQGITDPEERMRKVMRAFGRQTTQRFTAEEVNNFEQMMGERDRMMQGFGNQAGFDVTKNESVSANIENVKRAWENLQIAVAGPQGENVIKFLQSLTNSLNSMTEAVRGLDPSTLKNIGIGIAALGAALIGGGAVALLAAIGPAGWLIGAIAALGVVAANTVDWKKASDEWDSVLKILQSHAVFDAVVRELGSIGTAISNLSALAWDSVTSGLNSISSAISKFIDWLKSLNPFAGSGSQPKSWSDWGNDPGGRPSGSPIPFKKSSFLGGGAGDSASIIPANFTTGSDKKQILQPITMQLNIDGRALAQTTSTLLEDYYEHPTGSPSPDGLGQFRPHGNFSST